MPSCTQDYLNLCLVRRKFLQDYQNCGIVFHAEKVLLTQNDPDKRFTRLAISVYCKPWYTLELT